MAKSAPVLPDAPAPAPAASPSGDEAIYFSFDDAIIQGDSTAVLRDIARRLLANPRARVRIEGNCDERGTTQYNIVLGESRARSARDYLVRMGVAPGRIQIVSYGSERPRQDGHDETAWARNRRDDFVMR